MRILFQRLRLMADVDTSASAVETLDADKGGYDPPSEYNHAHSHSHFLSQPVAHANLLPASATTRGGSGSQASSSQTVQCLHGAKAACEIMDSLVQLIGRRDESFSQAQMEETIIFALEMVHTGTCACRVCVRVDARKPRNHCRTSRVVRVLFWHATLPL